MMTAELDCPDCGHPWCVHEVGHGCCGTSTGTINGTPCRCTR